MLERDMLERTRAVLDRQVRTYPACSSQSAPQGHALSTIRVLGLDSGSSLTHGAQRSVLLDTETIQRYLGLVDDEDDEELVEEDFT